MAPFFLLILCSTYALKTPGFGAEPQVVILKEKGGLMRKNYRFTRYFILKKIR